MNILKHFELIVLIFFAQQIELLKIKHELYTK